MKKLLAFITNSLPGFSAVATEQSSRHTLGDAGEHFNVVLQFHVSWFRGQFDQSDNEKQT